MSDLLELAERCEQATGSDRELDMAICLALDTGRRVTGDGRWLGPDHFTASLDAAMTLVPEGMEWETGSVGWARLRPSDTIDQLDPRVVLIRKAATPALALCAAALRARASQEERP